MDLRDGPEEAAFRRTLRAWLEAKVPAGLRGFRGWSGPAALALGRDWSKRLAEAGYAGLTWPKEYGGAGRPWRYQALYLEELARAEAPQHLGVIGLGMAGPTIIAHGRPDQKARYLAKILSAEEIWCQGFSEPGSGSDLASVRTRVELVGDHFVVNGQKVWTSDAYHADMCILLVRTDPSAPKHQGISYILVDMHSPGVTVRPLVQITGESGFNEVFFEDVRVPKANLVGERNRGWQVAITTLMFERSGLGGGRDLTGHVRELVNLAQSLTLDGHTAWEDSSVRQKIAQFACEAAALKYTRYRQITRRLQGLPPGPEGSVLKLAMSELSMKINTFAMEMLGPYSQIAFKAPTAIAGGKWSYRALAARALTIAGGTSEIQRNIIGERVLGLPKG